MCCTRAMSFYAPFRTAHCSGSLCYIQFFPITHQKRLALTGRERLRQGNAVIDLVASKLVNTRAVCRSSYIHPLVLEQYEAGTLKDIMRLRLPRRAELVEWLDEDELRVLKWLKQNSSGEAQN